MRMKTVRMLPKLKSVERVSMHCNIVKNDYKRASKVLFTFEPDKQFRQLTNTSRHSVIMLNNIKTEFSFINLWY